MNYMDYFKVAVLESDPIDPIDQKFREVNREIFVKQDALLP